MDIFNIFIFFEFWSGEFNYQLNITCEGNYQLNLQPPTHTIFNFYRKKNKKNKKSQVHLKK